MSQPADGASFAQGTTVALAATAGDTDGTVSRVEFYAGQTKLGEDTTAPYQLSWANAAPGSHQLTARATDNQNASTTSAPRTITITSPPPPGNSPPTVGLSQPADGASFAQGTTVALAATAGDTDGTVSRVEFYAGQTKLGEDTTAPYQLSWANAAPGSHQLTARATDNQNASTTQRPARSRSRAQPTRERHPLPRDQSGWAGVDDRRAGLGSGHAANVSAGPVSFENQASVLNPATDPPARR